MKFIQTLILLTFAYSSFAQTGDKLGKNEFHKDNYKIQYPNSWSLDTSGLMGTKFFIFSPVENTEDKFKENVSMIIQSLSGQNIDLEKYKKITDDQIAQMATDGKVFESAVLNSNKGKYYKIDYATTQGQFRLKIISLCYIKNEKAYLLTFTAELDKYDRYKKMADEILNSFMLTN